MHFARFPSMACDLSLLLPPPLPPEIQCPHGYIMLLAEFSPPQPAGLKGGDQLLHFCTAPPLLNSPKRVFFSHSPTSSRLLLGR
jgi:hypothetical protein